MSTVVVPATEKRNLSLATAGVQLREAAEGEMPQFVGHAVVFDSRTAIGNPLSWGFYEEIAPGAATKTIAEGDQRFLIDHDSALAISRVSAGTLTLSTDKVGVLVNSTLNTRKSYVSDLVENLRDGTITGMSFGFRVIKDKWDTETVETSDGQSVEVEVRRIHEMQIVEVSAVTFPAYEATDAGLRSGELADVAAALVRRGDVDAIEKRAAYRPELLDFRQLIREPRESTRDTSPEPSGLTPDETVRRMSGLAARYGLK